jgi:hypothetical protein
MEAFIVAGNVLIVVVDWQFVIAEYPLTTSGSLNIFINTIVRATIDGLEGLQLCVAPCNHQTHGGE